MRRLMLPVVLVIAATMSQFLPAVAQAQVGCCQFAVRGADGHTIGRRCDNVTRDDCLFTRPVATFFKDLQCDLEAARCVRELPARTPTRTAVSTGTPTTSLTPTRTNTPTITTTPTITVTPTPASGCCELNNISRLRHPVCGNNISRVTCMNDFEGTPDFCEDCVCTSHTGPWFDFSLDGSCVTRTPTRTPTPTTTPSHTFTPAGPFGCCQLDNLPRIGHPICGNAVSQVSCMNDFDGAPTFCADCLCTSHAGSGFDFLPGVCTRRTATPTRTPTRTPTATLTPTRTPPARGCCQLSNVPGFTHPFCGNDIAEVSCLNDFAGNPTFCADCVCSSHSGSGFSFDSGACVNTRPRPRHSTGAPRPRPTRVPRVPRVPHRPGA